MTGITYHTKSFNELTCGVFHDIIRLREQVFVVEQNCPYLDVDGKDPLSTHIYARLHDEVVGYCRVLPPGVSYNEWSIGRVVTHHHVRRHGVGTKIMLRALGFINTHESKSVCISAQTYLKEFYEQLGFRATGKYYLEDNLPHMQMRRD